MAEDPTQEAPRKNPSDYYQAEDPTDGSPTQGQEPGTDPNLEEEEEEPEEEEEEEPTDPGGDGGDDSPKAEDWPEGVPPLRVNNPTDDDRKAWVDQWTGLRKEQGRIETESKRLESLDTLDKMLTGGADGATHALHMLAASIERSYGMTPGSLMGGGQQQQNAQAQGGGKAAEPEVDLSGLDDADAAFAKLILDKVGGVIDQRLGIIKDDLTGTMKPVLEDYGNRQQADQATNKARSEHPAIQATLANQYGGYEVTVEQVRDAIMKHPDLAPLEAVRFENMDAILKFVQNKAARGKTRAPEMPRNQAKPGQQPKGKKGRNRSTPMDYFNNAAE